MNSYIGDDTQNRAIPHGLGKIPRYVSIAYVNGGYLYRIYDTEPTKLTVLYASYDGHEVMTAMDNINFYVGNSPPNGYGANYSSGGYSWVAFA